MGRYNRWVREKLAERIRNNGGYSRHNAGTNALSWCVRYYDAIDDADDAMELLVECGHFVNMTDLTLQFPDFADWFEDQDRGQWYNYAQEHLQDDLADDEGLRMWAPDTAKRYGFDYAGKGADRPFDMKLEGLGGGGKHVTLTEFEGHTLGLSSEYLADSIELIDPSDYTTHYSNEWCRQLMGIMDELDKYLTHENAKRCGRYYQADEIARSLGLFD